MNSRTSRLVIQSWIPHMEPNGNTRWQRQYLYTAGAMLVCWCRADNTGLGTCERGPWAPGLKVGQSGGQAGVGMPHHHTTHGTRSSYDTEPRSADASHDMLVDIQGLDPDLALAGRRTRHSGHPPDVGPALARRIVSGRQDTWVFG